ncbi:PIN domain nuclease, a component of toxin-antitoxin system (PIN domain) [Parapedobacter luteus]|uniref:PIN domain nuclease, a component of toxin-antitoxin system (PIN domain) n=1 Tax=Parapedobacter luteus TaxID=623280 RepID=A0A1T5F6W1_9SPHI|nr:type II toxin-antitoxin system VapC family toxin [Parapedobacter luteus]SKB91907.1 PIN domain nuclease, a component of toxin-antitoxin system (PIN domain) [Parapedobacter luteus]
MYYLLDTHVCIWALADQSKLSDRVRETLESNDNGFFISKMSFFEIAIKLKIGKLTEFSVSLNEFIDATYRSGYNTLSIKDEHFRTYMGMNFAENHRDPFDRYLLATAKYENLSFITKDEKFEAYKESYPIIW